MKPSSLEKNNRSISPSPSPDALSLVAEMIAEKTPIAALDHALLATALRDLIEAPDDRGRMARQLLTSHILEVHERLDPSPPAQAHDRLLTTEQAARMMRLSRPYVAMLVDAGELAGASTTPKGHRRVPESSVRSWLRKQGQPARASDYKAAAREAGMYLIAESAYVQAASRRRRA